MGGALPIELWRHISSTRAFSLDNVNGWVLLHPELSRPDAPLLRGPLIGHAKWHSRQGSNLHPAVLETAAPSLELREYRSSLIALRNAIKLHFSRPGNRTPFSSYASAFSNKLCRHIKSRPWNRTSRVYTHAPRSKLRSGGHIKTAPVRRRGCLLAHILSGKLHLDKDSKAFSWHGRLHVQPCGLSGPCAIRCEAADLHRTGLPLNRYDASHRSSPRNVKREQSPIPASRKGGKCQEGTRFGGCVASVSPLSAVPLIPILPHLTCNNNNDNM